MLYLRVFFVMMCPLHQALLAQLDRVQVSEACGVGSSPAERTIFLSLIVPFCLKTVYIKGIQVNSLSQFVVWDSAFSPKFKGTLYCI